MADEAVPPRWMALFAAEAQEALQAITRACLALEKAPDPAQRMGYLAGMLRQMHNLKGMARSLELEEIAVLAHQLETMSGALESASGVDERRVTEIIYRTVDGISRLIEGAAPGDMGLDRLLSELEMAAANAAAPQPQQPAAGGAPIVEEMISASHETARVSLSRLDVVFNLVNELQTTCTGLERNLKEMRRLLDSPQPLAPQNGALAALRSQFDELHHRSELNQHQMSQLLSQLQDHVRRARMLPLATVFDALPGMARNLARELGKRVELRLEGEDIAVDRSVLEQLRFPLQHLLRNSIDHGLETAERRLAAGKAEGGQIVIRAVRRGSSIQIEIGDDGAGIDAARVKEHAVRCGLLAAGEADGLGEQEIMQLLFQPGFSLSAGVTAHSGRGVGLDVVRQVVEGMQGSIHVDNRPGEGARFTLTLPLSIATAVCLLIRANGQLFALPARSVTRLMRAGAGNMRREGGRPLLTPPGAEPIPVVSWASSLAEPAPPEAEGTAVIIGPPEQPAALLVEGLHEVQELVIKKLPWPYNRRSTFAGASIVGTGAVVLVLNVTELMRAAR